MKHIQFVIREPEEILPEVKKIRQWSKRNLYSSILFHLFTEDVSGAPVKKLSALIRQAIPDAHVVACSTNGNIVNGDYSGAAYAVSCFLFEYPSTKVEVLQYPLTADSQDDVVRSLMKEVEARPWVKGVELLVTIRGMSMTGLCEKLSGLPEGVHIFGGGALSGDLDSNDAFVFSDKGEYMEKGIVFVLYGGDELYLDTRFVTGWKPLGAYFKVTAAEGCILKEINHLPAYETYRKYLHIPNDAHFFANTREFPFFYHMNGIDILRAPIESHPDGSLTMTSDMPVNVSARLAYGDPRTILDSAWQEGNALLSFSPESILVFSCAGRRTFWGNQEIGKETEPYQIVAPTAGFYTSGEFLRTGTHVNQHNETQVIVSMREGDPKQQDEKRLAVKTRVQEGKVSMIRRMATFIKVTTEELEETNRKLQEANALLSELAVVDSLTHVGNKNAYFETVKTLEEAMETHTARFSVAVFDLNGLKIINDTYGHEAGDTAICESARLLIQVFGVKNMYRIGGDEFIAVLPEKTEQDMQALFAELDRQFDERNRTCTGLSIGLSKGFSVCGAEESDYKVVFRRADEAMYQDKAEYYKTHKRR
ncbi:MAG: diguanylate cyclase [Oscillospiraceae bacterium]|nr:diguanylate cyclase [Oscillospiraceae bacterium]